MCMSTNGTCREATVSTFFYPFRLLKYRLSWKPPPVWQPLLQRSGRYQRKNGVRKSLYYCSDGVGRSVQFLLFGNFPRPRPRGVAAHVNHVGAIAQHFFNLHQNGCLIGITSAIVKAVRGDVEDTITLVYRGPSADHGGSMFCYSKILYFALLMMERTATNISR